MCCDNVLFIPEDNFHDALDEDFITDQNLFAYIIKQKDNTINELREKNKLLNLNC